MWRAPPPPAPTLADTVKAKVIDFIKRGHDGTLSTTEIGLAVLIGLPVFLLSPPILPHFLTVIMNLKKFRGRVRGAYLSFNWRGHLFLTLQNISLTNPKGFDEPKMVNLRYIQVGVSPWSLLFTRYCYIPHIIIRELKIWVEKKEGRLNAAVYMKERQPQNATKEEKKEDKSAEDDDDGQVVQLIMSLLGLVNPSNMIDNVNESLEKQGGVTGIVGNTVQGTADKAENILRLGLDTVTSGAKTMQDSVNEAGGIDKWVGQQAQGVTEGVSNAVGSVTEEIQSDGLVGAVNVVHQGATRAVSAVTDGGENAFLQEQLHRKVLGCYEEPDAKAMYLWVRRFVVEPYDRKQTPKSVSVSVRGLFDQSSEGEQGIALAASQIVLAHAEELAPHPNARRKTGLPIPEFTRRLKLMINFTMQKENKSVILKIAQAGAKEAASIQDWLMPKVAADAIGGVATDVSRAFQSMGVSAQKLFVAPESSDADSTKTRGRSTSPIAQRAGSAGWSIRSLEGSVEEEEADGLDVNQVVEGTGKVVGAAVDTTKDAVGAAVDTTKDAAAKVTKGTTELLGSVVQGTGDTLSQWTGTDIFKSVGEGVGGGITDAGNFIGGVMGGQDDAKDKAV